MSPKNFLDGYVLRSFEDYKRSEFDEYLARIACMFSFHMHEVLFKSGDNEFRKALGRDRGNYQKSLIDCVPGFGLVEAVSSPFALFNEVFIRTGCGRRYFSCLGVVVSYYLIIIAWWVGSSVGYLWVNRS